MMLNGSNLFLHTVVPVLAIVSFLFVNAYHTIKFKTTFLAMVPMCSDEYGRIDLDIEGFGSYKLYFVPHAKEMESKLFRFFDGVMNNT